MRRGLSICALVFAGTLMVGDRLQGSPLPLHAAKPATQTTQSPPSFTTERTIASPNGSFVFLLERDTSTGALAWSATLGKHPLVTRGTLDMGLKAVGNVGDKGPVGPSEIREVKTTWKPPYGERSEIPDHFREETMALAPPAKGGPPVRLQVRAYDEGLAFRYLVDDRGAVTLVSEKTSFPLPANTDVWASGKAQGKIIRQPVSALKGKVERPLTAQLAPNLFAALGEAALVKHPRMKFAPGGGSTLVASLDGPAVYADAFATPWRYVRASSSPGGLLERNYFLLNLNEPNQIGDTAWLRPGKVLREVTLTTEGAKTCVDFAANHNFEPVSVSRTGLGMEAGPSCMNQTNTPKENTTPSKRPRRHYDAEFKKAAVEHCARHGGDLSGTAGELGINYWTLRDWVEAARATAAPSATPRTAAELEAEVRRLRGELARVTEQRESSGAR